MLNSCRFGKIQPCLNVHAAEQIKIVSRAGSPGQRIHHVANDALKGLVFDKLLVYLSIL
jgi:hypothetical protein